MSISTHFLSETEIDELALEERRGVRNLTLIWARRGQLGFGYPGSYLGPRASPSFLRILATWLPAVRSEIESSRAIWRLVRPRATRMRYLRSRELGWSGFVGPRGSWAVSAAAWDRLHLGEGVPDGLLECHRLPLGERLFPCGLA